MAEKDKSNNSVLADAINDGDVIGKESMGEKSSLWTKIFKNKKSNEIKEVLEKIPSPFPNHKGYTEVWEKLTPDQQEEMKNNIRITSDGKVEMMNKKFSILTAQENNKDVWDGSFVGEREGKTGIPGVKYFNGRAAEKECEKQGKKLLENKDEVKAFIDLFPGKHRAQKILNFAKLFGLKKSGWFGTDSWGSSSKDRGNGPDGLGYAMLSKVDEKYDVHGIRFAGDDAKITKSERQICFPYVACESV